MFSRPFEIGDWIEVGDHEGIVTDITSSTRGWEFRRRDVVFRTTA